MQIRMQIRAMLSRREDEDWIIGLTFALIFLHASVYLIIGYFTPASHHLFFIEDLLRLFDPLFWIFFGLGAILYGKMFTCSRYPWLAIICFCVYGASAVIAVLDGLVAGLQLLSVSLILLTVCVALNKKLLAPQG